MRVAHERGVHAVAEHPPRPQPGYRVVPARDVRDAAAEDDHVGIDDVDHVRKRAREPILVARERRFGMRVDVGGGRDGGHVVARPAAMQPIVAQEPGTGQERLDARAAAAKACMPGALGVAGPGQGIVSPLARDAVVAAEHATVDDEAAAHAGPEDHAEHDRRAARGAIARFRQREAVRVVGHRDRAREARFKVVLDGHAVQADRVRAAQQPRRGRQRTRRRHAYVRFTLRDVARRFRFAHEPGDEAEDRVVIVDRRRLAPSHERAPVGGERNDLRLGSAEVDPDAQRRTRMIHAAPSCAPLAARRHVPTP